MRSKAEEADRPELAKALYHPKLTGATLVIAKRDRVSRNAAFLLAIRDSGARFVAVDKPEANDLTVGIMALVAEAETKGISRRTRKALAVAKARAAKLGNPKGAEAIRRAGMASLSWREVVTANAAVFDADLVPVLADIRGAGAPSLRAIAARINTHWTRTRRIEK